MPFDHWEGNDVRGAWARLRRARTLHHDLPPQRLEIISVVIFNARSKQASVWPVPSRNCDSERRAASDRIWTVPDSGCRVHAIEKPLPVRGEVHLFRHRADGFSIMPAPVMTPAVTVMIPVATAPTTMLPAIMIPPAIARSIIIARGVIII